DVETVIYAFIMGESASGTVEYVSGKAEYGVHSRLDVLTAHGSPIAAENLIQFRLDRPGPGNSEVEGVEEFTIENSSIDEFMNILPAEVRFIGLAALQQSEGTITAPVRFDPGMGVDLPLHLASGTFTFTDTLV